MALVTARDATLINIIATTVAKYSRKIADNVHDAVWLFNLLNKKGNIELVDGGESFMEPLAYAASMGGWYSDAMTATGDATQLVDGSNYADRAVIQQFGDAYFPVAQLWAGISVTGLEASSNAGSSRVVSLVKGKIDQAKRTLVSKIESALYTTTSNAITSLQDLCPQGGAGTLGGIDSSTYTWWKPKLVTGQTWSTLTSAQLLEDLASLYRKVRIARGNPKVLVMHSSIYAKYEAAASATVAMPWAGNRTGDIAFADLTYKGIPIIYSDDATGSDATNYMVYMLDTDYQKLKVFRNKNVSLSEWTKVPGRDLRVAQFYWYGNLVCSKRNAQGVLKYDSTA